MDTETYKYLIVCVIGRDPDNTFVDKIYRDKTTKQAVSAAIAAYKRLLKKNYDMTPAAIDHLINDIDLRVVVSQHRLILCNPTEFYPGT